MPNAYTKTDWTGKIIGILLPVIVLGIGGYFWKQINDKYQDLKKISGIEREMVTKLTKVQFIRIEAAKNQYVDGLIIYLMDINKLRVADFRRIRKKRKQLKQNIIKILDFKNRADIRRDPNRR